MTLRAPLGLTETEGALNLALLYASLGWQVFPLHAMQGDACSCGNQQCSSPAKHPRTRRGHKDASSDDRQIRTWWKRWPDANVGIATGQGSGLVVIDIDPRHGGTDTWEALKSELEVPETWEVGTGGGGIHAYFLYPDGASISIGAGVLGSGVDHRGDGGYVVAPPSNHASGGDYFWDVNEGEPLAELPATLAERLTTQKGPLEQPPAQASPGNGPSWWAVARLIGMEGGEIAAIAERLDDPSASLWAKLYEPGNKLLPKTIPEGERHDTSVRLAGLLRRIGATDSVVEAVLNQVAERRMQPSWDASEREREISNIVTSTSKWPTKRVRWPVPSVRGLAEVLTEGNEKLADLLQNEPIRHALRRLGRDGWDLLQLSLVEAGVKRDAVAAVRSIAFPRRASKSAARQPDERPWLFAQEGDLTVITPRAWSALAARNDPPRMFLCDGRPVRLAQDDDGSPVLEELTISRMRHALARAAHFYIHVNDRAVEVLPPKALVEDVLAMQNPAIPPLRRIVEVPVLGPDGTLQTEPGYHEAGKTLFVPPPGFELPPVPERPNHLDTERARQWIDELLVDFPFLNQADRAHAVALFVLPYVRDVIGDDPTPGHLIEAPTPGTGKSLLADVLTYPFAGRAVSTITEARDDDEWRKRLTAQRRERRAVIVLDNIVRPLDTGALASALTASVWEDRILGKNETIRVPVRCIWIATGNNVTLSTELARRFIRIRIDPRMDRPFQREGFRHNPLRSWARRYRHVFVWAALVLARRWLADGAPSPSCKPLGGYERWSAVIGGILEHARVEGFLANVNELYEAADTEGALWRAFVSAWWDTHHQEEVTTKDLFGIAESIDGLVSTRGNERSQRTSFGRKLSKQHDRVFGEYQVVSTGKRKNAKVWRLIHIGPDASRRVNLDAKLTRGSPGSSPSTTSGNDYGKPPSDPPQGELGELSPSFLNAREPDPGRDRDRSPIEQGYREVPLCSPEAAQPNGIQGETEGELPRSDVHLSSMTDEAGSNGADPEADRRVPTVRPTPDIAGPGR